MERRSLRLTSLPDQSYFHADNSYAIQSISKKRAEHLLQELESLERPLRSLLIKSMEQRIRHRFNMALGTIDASLDQRIKQAFEAALKNSCDLKTTFAKKDLPKQVPPAPRAFLNWKGAGSEVTICLVKSLVSIACGVGTYEAFHKKADGLGFVLGAGALLSGVSSWVHARKVKRLRHTSRFKP